MEHVLRDEAIAQRAVESCSERVGAHELGDVDERAGDGEYRDAVAKRAVFGRQLGRRMDHVWWAIEESTTRHGDVKGRPQRHAIEAVQRCGSWAGRHGTDAAVEDDCRDLGQRRRLEERSSKHVATRPF